MNWDQIEGNWKRLRGRIKQKWAKLTDDDLEFIDGKRLELLGKIQERHGITKEKAERELDDFMEAIKQ